MPATADIVRLLGGSKILGKRVSSSTGLIQLIRQGLPYASLEATTQVLRLSPEQIARCLALPGRTLARRKRERRLRPEESDRLCRLAWVVTTAFAVFGDMEKTRRWLGKPNRALGGDIPLSLLDTDAGTGMVEEILGRIEDGVLS